MREIRKEGRHEAGPIIIFRALLLIKMGGMNVSRERIRSSLDGV